jgi:tetratricopeptide (TPR) repeat protein
VTQLSLALDKVRGDPDAVALAAELQKALEKAEAAVAALQGGDRVRKKVLAGQTQGGELFRHEDEAEYHGTNLTGKDPETNLRIVEESAAAGLKVFAISLDAPVLPTLDPEAFPDEAVRQEIRDGCFELLLVWAGAHATPRAGETPEQRKNRREQALAVLDRAAALGVRTRALPEFRASLLFDLERFQEAAAVGKEAKGMPIDALYAFRQGVAVYNRPERLGDDRFTEAIGWFDTALRLRPRYFWPRYYQAVCRFRLNQYEAAEANLGACLSRRQDLVWPYLLRGFARFELGQALRKPNLEAARAKWEEADRDFKEAEARRGRDDAQAGYVVAVSRGLLAHERGRPDEAVKELEAAIKLRPAEPSAYINLAKVRRTGDLAGARQALDEAIRQAPRSWEAYHERGLLRKPNDPPGALADFEQTVALEPAGARGQDRANHLVECGDVLLSLNQPERALEYYDRAVAAWEGHPTVHRSRGQTLARLAEGAAAESKIEKLTEAEAAYGQHIQRTREPDAEVYEERGLVRAQLGNQPGQLDGFRRLEWHALAVDDYTRALELNPMATSVRLARGQEVLLVMVAPKLALRDFEKAVIEAPSADAYVGRGLCRVQLGDHKGAVQDAEATAALPKKDVERLVVQFNLSRLYAQAVGRVDAEAAGNPTVDQRALRQSYESRAVERLSQTLAKLPEAQRTAFWRTTVAPEKAFDPVRRGQGFRDLTAKYAPREK